MKRKKQPAKDPSKKAAPVDSIETLGRLEDAMVLIEVAAEALEAREVVNPATVVLEAGLAALRRAYTEVDLALCRLGRGGRVPKPLRVTHIIRKKP